MYMKQKELLKALDKPFIGKIISGSVQESHEKGEILFREGDEADNLYVLIKGCVKLGIGDIGHTVFMAKHPGELFGWSSILGRENFSATAVCLEPSTVRKVEKKNLLKLLQDDSKNGLIFYKKLAETLGKRLLHSYSISTAHTFAISEGTGQLQELFESV